MIGANGGGQIAIQRHAQNQRRMPIDVAVLKRHELGQNARIGIEHAGEIHHLGQPDNLGMASKGFQILNFQRRTGGLKSRGGYARRQVEPHIHHGLFGAIEEIANALRPDHIGDFVRITDRRRHPIGQHATVKLERGHQRGFDMQMGIDKTGNGEAPTAVDYRFAIVVCVGPHDPVGDDGDVGSRHRAGDHIEQLHVLDHHIGRFLALAGHDHTGEGLGIGHGAVLSSFPPRLGWPASRVKSRTINRCKTLRGAPPTG